MDASRLAQIMHAQGLSNGNRYRWRNYFEPSADLIAPFESENETEPTWEDFDL